LGNSPLGMMSLNDDVIEDLARKLVSPDILDAFVLVSDTFAVVQTLPPEPVEEPMSSDR
jgi:hypothetical protein